jgi:hypothetical protein
MVVDEDIFEIVPEYEIAEILVIACIPEPGVKVSGNNKVIVWGGK